MLMSLQSQAFAEAIAELVDLPGHIRVLGSAQIGVGHLVKCLIKVQVNVGDGGVLGPQIDSGDGLAFSIPQRKHYRMARRPAFILCFGGFPLDACGQAVIVQFDKQIDFGGCRAHANALVSRSGARSAIPHTMLNLLLILVMLGIVVSLGFGLFFLVRDPGQSRRTVHSLSIRVALAVLMLALLAYGFVTRYLI